jgi:hypothetical protein
MVSDAAFRDLVGRWREDAGGTYQSWFLWSERLKVGARYIPYGELAAHRDAMARFGSGLRPLERIARQL